MKSQHKDNETVLFQFSRAISFLTDSKGLERHIVEILKKQIKCNSILVFQDQGKNKLFVAHNPFNLGQDVKESLTISHDNPISEDLLIHRKNVVRIKAENPILPLMNSELFVPIVTPDNVLGCLYLSRLNSKGFSDFEENLAQQAASYLATALERQKWEENFKKLEKTIQVWQDKYITLLQSIPFAAAIIDLDTNSCEEVNKNLLNILGYDLETFIDKPFSEICTFPEDFTNQLESKQFNVFLKKNDGNEIENAVLLNSMEDLPDSKKLLLFLPNSYNEQQHDRLFSEFQKSIINVDYDQDFQHMFEQTASLLIKSLNAKYITIQKVTLSSDLKIIAAYCIEDEKIRKPESTFLENLQKGIFQNVVKIKKSFFITNVDEEPAFEQWKALAKKLQYSSIASIPFFSSNKVYGLFNIFCEKPFLWGKKSQSLVHIANSIARLVRLNEYSQAINEWESENKKIEDFSQSIGIHDELNEMVFQIAQNTHALIYFDYFSLTLFAKNGADTHFFEIAHSSFKDQLSQGSEWLEIEDTPFAWIKRNINLQNKSKLPFSMPAHISMLLIHGEEYLGNFALGRIVKNTFSDKEREFLKQLAKRIAFLIRTNQRIYDLDYKMESMANLLNVYSSLDIIQHENKFLENLLHIIAEKFDFSFFISVDNREKLDIKKMFAFLPNVLHANISEEKTRDFMSSLQYSPQPFYFKSAPIFYDKLCTAKNEEEAALFKPFVVLPIHVESQVKSFFIFEWKGVIEPDVYTKIFINPLVSYVKQIISINTLLKDADKKAEDLKVLISSISHDFKTPIQNLRNFVSMLATDYGDYLPEEPQKYLLRILTNLDNMDSMVMDLLELHRLNLQVENKSVNVAEIVQAVLSRVDSIIEEHKIQIFTPQPLPVIKANPMGLTQIFSNLLSNAVRFVKKAENPEIVIGFEQKEGFFEFYVKDNGPGIAPSFHEKIFELFFKKDDEYEKSTGIGLAIVKKAVELHTGHVWVESKKGEGATFRFTIPQQNKPNKE